MRGSSFSSREGNGTPLQYSCLENSMEGGDWWAAVRGVAKSWTWPSHFTFTVHFHTLEKETGTHSSALAWRVPGTGEPGGLPSMGSCRVGHWSDLAAAAAVSLQFAGAPLPLAQNKVKESEVAQSCPTLCDSVDCSPPGSSVHGILQARVLEWVAIAFSRGSSRPRDWTQVSRIAGRCFTIWATREAQK